MLQTLKACIHASMDLKNVLFEYRHGLTQIRFKRDFQFDVLDTDVQTITMYFT